MLIQQMKSTPSIKIEANDIELPTGQSCEKSSLIDTPSIAIANYNNQYTTMYDQKLLPTTTLYTITKNHIIHLNNAEL